MISVVYFVQLYFVETMEYGKSILRLTLSIVAGAVSYIGVLFLLWTVSGKPEGPESVNAGVKFHHPPE